MTETAARLGWIHDEFLAMNWIYIDESGEHDAQTGYLRRLTLGACVAERDAWDSFEVVWHEMLRDFGLTSFHMADFEKWKSPFNFTLRDGSRDRQKHEDLLNRALSAIEDHVVELIGFVAEPAAHRDGFVDAYDASLAKAFRDFWRDARSYKRRATLVFARHENISEQRIEAYVDLWSKDGDCLDFGGISSPQCVLPLQASDVIAYEMSRWARDKRPVEDRYPLRRLKESFRKKRGRHSKFMLTFV